MSFNSLYYAIFLLLICAFFRVVNREKQRVALLCANIIFFLSNSLLGTLVLLLVIIITYFYGRIIEKKHNKHYLIIGITSIICPLLIFKYSNFFFNVLGYDGRIIPFNLPIGISFYTFAAISYIVDVHRRKIRAEKSIIYLASFLSAFFCYGGPIERASSLLEQIREDKDKISIDNYSIGFRRILFGCFLKVFVADSIAGIVNQAYNNVEYSSGIYLLITTILFGIQLYCDFSGYSLMALGSANCLGFDVTNNFNSPYMSVSVTDFWRRWHISLSTWFRDYVYIPLGGSRKSKLRTHINRLITFTLSGLWHGANWTFILWGFLNGVYLCFESLFNLKQVDKKGIKGHLGRAYTLILINFSWIFFRANSLKDAYKIICKISTGIISEIDLIITKSISIREVIPIGISQLYNYALVLLGIIVMVSFDVLQYKSGDVALNMKSWPSIIRWSVYIFIGLLLMVFGCWTTSGTFLYLNF